MSLKAFADDESLQEEVRRVGGGHVPSKEEHVPNHSSCHKDMIGTPDSLFWGVSRKGALLYGKLQKG